MFTGAILTGAILTGAIGASGSFNSGSLGGFTVSFGCVISSLGLGIFSGLGCVNSALGWVSSSLVGDSVLGCVISSFTAVFFLFIERSDAFSL
ncbi:hypothetical protein ACN6AX_12545 [Paenibacillus polymyxa]|uniref:hypothetical protein n=1 Tax=Paenibacillus polymyxa TaxID=1406 RepID=UPI0035277EBF